MVEALSAASSAKEPDVYFEIVGPAPSDHRMRIVHDVVHGLGLHLTTDVPNLIVLELDLPTPAQLSLDSPFHGLEEDKLGRVPVSKESK